MNSQVVGTGATGRERKSGAKRGYRRYDPSIGNHGHVKEEAVCGVRDACVALPIRANRFDPIRLGSVREKPIKVPREPVYAAAATSP